MERVERNMVAELIAKYWLNFILGIVAGGLTFFCKRFWNLYQAEKKHQKTQEQKEFYQGLQDLIKEGAEQSRAGDEKLQVQIDLIKEGVLSIHKKNFKQDCRDLLQPDREITIEEFESLQEEHNVYKSLGGNHDGDTLFNMVCEKAKHILANK